MSRFEPFFDPRLSGQRLDYEYSNPNYTTHWEFFINKTHRAAELRQHGNERYLGPGGSVWHEIFQGGYYCSIRSVTDFERPGAPHGVNHIDDHPNYWSRYMDRKVENDGHVYSNWTGMYWPAVNAKTAPLELREKLGDGPWDSTINAAGRDSKRHYTYTNEGHLLDGIWNVSGEIWEKGTCVIEFNRTCDDGVAPEDLESGLYAVLVQDTDLAFRPRVTYDLMMAYGPGRWLRHPKYEGECVDRVVRGCYNNGTCVAPDTCECAEGWAGANCTIPVRAVMCALSSCFP